MSEEKIIVRITHLNNVVHEGMGHCMHREMDLGIKLFLPDNLKFHGSRDYVEKLEAFLEYCLNKGFETYEPEHEPIIPKGLTEKNRRLLEHFNDIANRGG